MFRHGCSFPNLTEICLQKITIYKVYQFFESDKIFCERIQEDLTGGCFTRKTVLDQTFIRNSSKLSIEEIDQWS